MDSKAAAAIVAEKAHAKSSGRQLRPPDQPAKSVATSRSTRTGRLNSRLNRCEKLKEIGKPKGPIIRSTVIRRSERELFKEGSNKVFLKEGVEIAKEYDTPAWTPKTPSARLSSDHGDRQDRFAGIYAAMTTPPAGIAAMKGVGNQSGDVR